MESIEAALKELEPKFNDWSKKLTDYLQTFYTLEKKGTSEEAEIITFGFANMLNEVLEFAIKQNRLKDTWQPTMFTPYVDGLEISKQSARTETKFEFGTDTKGFYFQLRPHHLSNLKYMDDEFWELFLQLSKWGDFDFVVHESIGKVETVREGNNLNVGKSKVFNLLKNYLLFELYAEETYSFGSIRLNWPFPYFWEDLIQNLTMVFKACYKLDYLLWKTTYQKSMDKRKTKTK
jgi:hypothetical protein